MLVGATSGPARILASGDVCTFFGHPLELVFSVADGRTYTVTFRFRSDVDVDGVAVETAPEPWGLELTLVNFDDASGRGSATPVLLGEQDGVLYFLHFRVFRHGRSDDRTVQYTLFEASAQAVGWSGSAP